MKKTVLILIALFSFAVFDNVKAATSCSYDTSGQFQSDYQSAHYTIYEDHIVIGNLLVGTEEIYFLKYENGEVHGTSKYNHVNINFNILDGCPSKISFTVKDKDIIINSPTDTIDDDKSNNESFDKKVVKKCQYVVNSDSYNIVFYDNGSPDVYLNGDKSNECYSVDFKLNSNESCPSKLNFGYNNVGTCMVITRGKTLWDKQFEAQLSKKVSCGNLTDIPRKIPELTSYIVTLVQIAIPIALVIMGSIDLVKGIMAQKEDEIKKGYQMFIKRLVIGVLIFFVIIIVKFIISLVADSSTADIVDCIDCFISNVCD